MNTDIRIKLGQPDHIKTKKLIQIAGEESYRCLIRLWTKIAQDQPEGMTEISRNDVELIADWLGETGIFATALVESGYFEQYDNGLLAHDWHEHQQWVIGATERSERARRNAVTGWKKRKEAKNASGMPASSQHQAGGMQPSDSGNAPILSYPLLSSPSPNTHKSAEIQKWITDFLIKVDAGICPNFFDPENSLQTICKLGGSENTIRLIYQEFWNEDADPYLKDQRANLNNRKALSYIARNYNHLLQKAKNAKDRRLNTRSGSSPFGDDGVSKFAGLRKDAETET